LRKTKSSKKYIDIAVAFRAQYPHSRTFSWHLC
jgi:hypothetical protein